MNVTMQISSAIISNKNVNPLVVFVDDNNQLQGNGLPADAMQYIADLLDKAQFTGKVNQIITDFQFQMDGIAGLLVVGLGDLQKLNANQIQKLAASLYKQIYKNYDAVQLLVGDIFTKQQFGIFSLAMLNAGYEFNQFKSKQDTSKLTDIYFVTDETLQEELDFAVAVHTGQTQARDLGNAPANVCYPESIAEQATKLANEFSDVLSVEVLDEKQMEALGMGCFLSVSKGSDRQGQLITFDYVGAGASNTDAPIVLVGKGVTFDTGGISIKPGAGMEEMKFDMCGAASVFGTIKALCAAKLPIRVVGTLACAENMPSGKATRPGDIVTSMSGQTVEILNTDAEGRLVLSDALTYVEKYNPSVVINMATLTGACVIALGHVRSAMYTKDMDLAADLIAASTYSHDRIWHMPLDDDYQEQLDSPCADIQNIGGRPAGSITAACFLSRFTKKYAWAHLDIAGTAWVSGKNRNATGRPVPLLMQYIRSSL